MSRFNAKKYVWELEEWLYVISCPFLGMPRKPIRWNYPSIHDWDYDERIDNYTIPAYIAFSIPPNNPPESENRVRLAKTLDTHFPGPYSVNGHDPHFVWAIRRPIRIVWELERSTGRESRHYSTFSTIEWSAFVRERRRAARNNGRVRGEIGPPVRDLRWLISDAEGVGLSPDPEWFVPGFYERVNGE